MEILKAQSFHFVGIGGSGMSALAQIVRAHGVTVSGSDRSFDRDPGNSAPTVTIFKNQGIEIYPQNGTGVKRGLNYLVVSSAIEETNPDIRAAGNLGISIITRAQLLSYIFNEKFGIAVGGTSGKSTVAAMIAFILYKNNFDPLYIGGGIINNFSADNLQSRAGMISNVLVGKSDIVCVETDESDGSIVLYKPKISVLTNISKDHKEVSELEKLFASFIKNTSGTVIINNDCLLTKKLRPAGVKTITFAERNDANFKAENIRLSRSGTNFTVKDVSFKLKLLGMHNVSNALAAISVCSCLKLPLEKISSALADFKGIKRRLELVGEKNGVKVYDDFSHNPAKVSAAIAALQRHAERMIIVFQPHGFTPTRLMGEEFVEAFSSRLSPADLLFMPEIFDAGGTADRSISSFDLVRKLRERHVAACYIPSKEGIKARLKKIARRGDTILVMGARDNSLSQFCEDILKSL